MSQVTYDVVTLGCKVNTYDTSLIEKKLEGGDFIRSAENPQVHIINSCAVTEKSSLETHKIVKKIKAHHPEALVVITGCVAQVDVDRLTTLTGADLIVGNSHKGQLEKIISDRLRSENSETQRVFHSNIFKKEALDEGGGIESSRTRAFLKIQDGCNSFCAFCIIPFARGKSRSLPAEHLVSRVNELHRQGFQEVVLTGVHCGDYEDGDINYAGLIEKVLRETRMPRVRLSSLEPIEIDAHLWMLFSDPRLCPHIHSSLQSANTKVIHEMKRKYGQDEIALFFEKFERHVPGGFIGMDVIAGFPGESEEEFADTLSFLEKQGAWTRIHVFPYSIRPGTLAARREDQLPEHVIHKRARALRDLSHHRHLEKARAQVGEIKKVLVLEKPSYGANALARDYWPVDVVGLSGHVNEEITVEISNCRVNDRAEPVLEGRLASSGEM